MSKVSSLLFQAAGWALVGVATLGLFLPLLPTTPFLLVASMCFVRSSPRAQRWLLNSRWFGPLLRDWNEHRAVRRPVKFLAVAVVSAVIAMSFWRDVHWLVRTLIVVLGLVGLTVIYCLPTVPKGPVARESADP
ncbi:MAG TPA: YbaN family protein [Tepidisphaeraceae bacterium]|nr:YbaN family protein [Tepidisphaeraceae bacterium]